MCLLEDGWEHQCYSFRIEISDATEGHCRPTLTEMLAEIAWCGEFCPMSHPELMGLLVISEMMWFEKVYRENSSGWFDCTKPSLTTSLQGKRCKELMHLFGVVQVHRTFLRYGNRTIGIGPEWAGERPEVRAYPSSTSLLPLACYADVQGVPSFVHFT